MAQRRTWSQRQGSVERCLQVLRLLDERSIQRRAERLSIETHIETPEDFAMPNRTAELIDEAGACFTNGQYTGCILALAAGIEHGFRTMRGLERKRALGGLIGAGVSCGYINNSEAEILLRLREYRNDAIHSNVDGLSAGKRLVRQSALRNEKGEILGSVQEEFAPESQDEKEIAASLSAEDKVGDLFVRAREAVYDIFDRYSAMAGTLEVGG